MRLRIGTKADGVTKTVISHEGVPRIGSPYWAARGWRDYRTKRQESGLRSQGVGMSPSEVLLTVLLALMALLYASVGHAGSSGYQAAMALMGVAPEVMK